MNAPFQIGPVLDSETFAEIRLRTIFECCKWDPQVEDSSVLARYPLVLSRETWSELESLAELLAEETVAVEAELLQRPEIWRNLGLPAAVRKALARGKPAAACARVMRFDFHFTQEGWRISEVNSDVPGGYIEASGFTHLMAEYHQGLSPCGDPAAALAEALAKTAGHEPATVALVHATAYSDDRQVMLFLARYFERVGLEPVLVSPEQINWRNGEAFIDCSWYFGRADVVYRFYPAEWLPNLPRRCDWRAFYANSVSPQSNPGWSLLSQSKRFGLLMNSESHLESKVPTWRQLLPQTECPRSVSVQDASWVLKPALGRVGDAIGIERVTNAKELRQIRRSAFFFPRDWVAQKRFDCVPVETPDGPRYVCLGVYTVNGRAAGIYCRSSPSPIINHLAQDVAVLVRESSSATTL